MKKTAFSKQIIKNDRIYKLVKLESLLLWKLAIGETRKKRRHLYSIFEDNYWPDRWDNSLPKGMYYKPRDIVIYDLIRKEDLPKARKGLIRLIKRCYSHKYLGGDRTTEDIELLVKGLDETIHSGNSWYRTCIFDFAYDKKLDSLIHHYEIRFRNFCSSYVAVEMHVALADNFINEIDNFVKTHYKVREMRIHRHWGRNNKKSGAKISYGVGPAAQSEYAKGQILYEQLQYVKQVYLKEIGNYFPLMEYHKSKDAYSINVFETNIQPSMELDHPICAGLGINDKNGFYFSPAERFYMFTDVISTRHNYKSDMFLVYNPEKITDYDMFITAHNKAIEYLIREYMDKLHRIVLIRNLGYQYKDLIGKFRNEINHCKASRRKHKKLLKLQYELTKEFYDFKKIDEELPVENELEQAEEYLINNEYAKRSIYYYYHTYKSFVDFPRNIWEQIKNNYSEIDHDLKRKLEISDAFSQYTNEKRIRWMTIVQLVLALATFFLLIFPEKALTFAGFIKNLYASITSLFINPRVYHI